jgi:hypothetical protein
MNQPSNKREFISMTIHENQWVWVVIQNPGGNEQFLGQYDKENDIAFIPTFLEKEDALKCLIHLSLDKKNHYEVQAILYEDLARDSAKNGFMIFIVNGSGEVLNKIDPCKTKGIFQIKPEKDVLKNNNK